MVNQTLFFKPRSKKLARIITITSPSGFRKSVTKLKKGGLTLKEGRALVLAKNRARAQLGRKNLSTKERKQFREIGKVNIPKFGKNS